MIRRPPRSTLFPYTRSSDLHGGNDQARSDTLRAGTPPGAHLAELRSALSQGLGGAGCPELYQGQPRSEEHTSELQSLAYLVCRLLLEKKKTNERILSDCLSL